MFHVFSKKSSLPAHTNPSSHSHSFLFLGSILAAQTTWTAWSGSVQSTMTARLLITGPKVV